MSTSFFASFHDELTAAGGEVSREVDGRLQLTKFGKKIYSKFFARHGLHFDPQLDEVGIAQLMEPLWPDWIGEVASYSEERSAAAVQNDYRARARSKLVEASLYRAMGMSGEVADDLRKEADGLMRQHLLQIIDGVVVNDAAPLSEEELARREDYRALALELRCRGLPIPGIDTPVVWL